MNPDKYSHFQSVYLLFSNISIHSIGLLKLKQQNQYFWFQLYYTMGEKQSKNIEEATERVKSRIPLEKLRLVPKYKDLSVEDYEQLIKDAETIALLILKALFLKK